MFGFVYLPVPLAPRTLPEQPKREYRIDARLMPLRQFFNRCECPAAEYAVDFLEVADEFALDWRLLPSLSFVESTGGKSGSHNNLFGWNSGRDRFDTPVAAIRFVGSHLAQAAQYRSKSLDQILATYNPVGEYAIKVKSVMQLISAVQ